MNEQTAQLPESVTEAESSRLKMLSFTLSQEAYAIPAGGIKEIIEYGGVTRVPMAPEQIRGVINLRGSVVPVVDLAARLGRGKTSVGKRTSIIIVEVGNEGERSEMGIVVDAVNEVLDLAAGEITNAPSFGANIPSEFIAAMGKVRGRFVVLLDLESVLSIDELSRLAA